MKPLKAAATTSQPVLTVSQIETIFFKVPELYEIHREFYDGLLPRVQQWSHHQCVGDLFQKLVRPFDMPLSCSCCVWACSGWAMSDPVPLPFQALLLYNSTQLYVHPKSSPSCQVYHHQHMQTPF